MADLKFRPVWPSTEREFARWLFTPPERPYRPARPHVTEGICRMCFCSGPPESRCLTDDPAGGPGVVPCTFVLPDVCSHCTRERPYERFLWLRELVRLLRLRGLVLALSPPPEPAHPPGPDRLIMPADIAAELGVTTNVFRPERFVISTETSQKLAEDGLHLESLEHHADGTSTVTFAPDDEESEC